MNEIWLPIKGYEGLYEISSAGRVRGLSRTVKRHPSCRFVPGGDRKLQKMPNGYLSVALRKDGKQKRFYVHRLVAEAFIDNPQNFREVNHIDEDKSNNNASNLEWCSHSYNVMYADGSKKRADKNKKPVVAIVGGNTVFFDSVTSAGNAFGIEPTTVSRCCRRVKKQTKTRGIAFMFKSEYEKQTKGVVNAD